MIENTNTTKWLQYLLYVGIAAMVNTIANIFLPSISVWLGYILTAAAVYLMFRLGPSNGRYLRAVLFAGAALIINVLGIQQIALAGAVCSIVGQYQEYTAHGELIKEQDPKLADKWGSLFWLQFAVSIITTLLSSVFVTVLVVSGNMDADAVTGMITVAAAMVVLILKVLYLAYLKRTIKILETEVEV